ncbi:TPA: Hsp20 family protein [Legionella pneumophila]|nr:Hsp20 family protein [Legionella pneumophila]HAU1682452.1 Hsp20 family protein [Legionella pneumophila]
MASKLRRYIMNTTSLSLTPLLRHSVGFERFNDLFESMRNADDSTYAYPAYDIEKHGEDSYTITMAVPGFQESDLNIMAQNDQLTVSGRIQEKKDEGSEYLHRGIMTRAFEHTFRLADHMKVTGAQIKNGLLSISLIREIPEEAKPRIIPIKSISDQESSKKGKTLEPESKKKISN